MLVLKCDICEAEKPDCTAYQGPTQLYHFCQICAPRAEEYTKEITMLVIQQADLLSRQIKNFRKKFNATSQLKAVK